MNSLSSLEIIREAIISQVFITNDKEYISTPDGGTDSWMFDFRRVMLHADILDAYATTFLEINKSRYPFQVCGLEVAAIPLISAIVMKSKQLQMPVNGFFIRKSRKKSGLLRMVEGEIGKEPIILVDDILNSGSTFIRQIEVLERLQKDGVIDTKVNSVSSILQFKDDGDYHYFNGKGVTIQTFFKLQYFFDLLPKLFIPQKKEVIPQTNFSIIWSWKAQKANYWYVRPKSTPLFLHDRIYFGTDSGIFYCLSANDGTTLFTYIVALCDSKKRTFSSPVVMGDILIFGASDGNLYGLNATTGKREWVFMEYDFLESDPCVIPKHTLVVFGVQVGLFKKKSAVVALSHSTGEKIWEFVFESSTQVYPSYSEKQDVVVVTTNDGYVYAFKGKSGILLWKVKTDVEYVIAPCVDDMRGLIILCGAFLEKKNDSQDMHSNLYICDIKNGQILFTSKGIEQPIYAMPVIYKDTIITTSLDKSVQAFSLESGERKWKTNLGSRIFSAPRICFFKSLQRSLLYVGTNNGHFFEIDPDTGTVTGKTIVTERITDAVSFDEEREVLFLATYANELYALKRKA